MNRLARIGTGYALVAAGTVMLVTPGPGLLTIAGGLALLSEDVAWAGRATNWIKTKIDRSSGEEDDQEAVDLDQAGG
ncbi:MAG TPA: PGPGW domain-containing protein [Acidimicrobiia bacterium]|nr:PGPGW domain-containing protein [Acidimicrobiia bacterium]